MYIHYVLCSALYNIHVIIHLCFHIHVHCTCIYSEATCIYMYMYMYMCMLQGTEHLPHISRESGVNIIAGTSYYFDKFISPDDKMLSVQEVHVHVHAFIHVHVLASTHYTSSAVQSSSLAHCDLLICTMCRCYNHAL